ncbi:MAG: T9SS type A sorting domain-containing protein [Mariniphaga sp.]|nr:T9SS type A sorting domain-containing protein [Mariniphaga sp.]
MSTEYKSICEGEGYLGWSEPDEYERLLEAANGGDSVVITILTVNPVYNITEYITIKEGKSYKGWTESGVYQDYLETVSGCDSIVITHLIVEVLTKNEKALIGTNTYGSASIIDLYPNPADTQVTVRFVEMPLEGTTIELLNSMGELIMSKDARDTHELLNIQNQATGVYFVITNFNGKYMVDQLMIR